MPSEKKYKVDIRPQGRNGPRYRRSFDTQREKLAFERWVMSQDENKKPWEEGQKADNRHLSELMQLWFDLHGQTLKDGAERLKLLLVTANALGDPIAHKLQAKEYTRYRAKRLKKVTANTCNHELAYVRSVYNELKRAGEIDYPNPLADIRPLKIDQPELAYLTHEQIVTLLHSLDQSQKSDAYMIARVCLATGARWGEAAGLKPSQLHKDRITYTATKSGKNRTVPVDSTLLEQVKCRLPFTDGYNTFKRTMKDLDIELPKGQLTHVLRHTFASHFMMNGGNILTLQRILGHADIKMTMRYAHLAPDHLNEALKFNPLA